MILVPEDKEMLKTFLDNYLFKNKIKNKLVASNADVELIIRPECNQKCSYCYITKYGNELYPPEKRVDNFQLLNNVNMLLNYFYENKCFVKSWEIFAGDLFYDDLFFDIMELFYNYFKKIQNNYSEIYEPLNESISDDNFNRSLEEASIVVPCNFSFCHNEEKKEHFRKIYNKLASVNAFIYLSYSTDGLYAIDNREKNSITNQEFYDEVFKFCAEFGFGCHPMIAPENIDNAIQNYQWWRAMYEKYFKDTKLIIPSMLEVRNDGWTKSKIEKYKEFLNYVFEDRMKIYNYDKDLMISQLLEGCSDNIDQSILHGPRSMDPIRLDVLTKDQNRISCNLGHSLCINCAHLTLVPCHRLTYSIFEGGEFKVENNKIVDIEPYESINGYFNQMFTNRLFEIKCQTCENRFFCLQGCHGSQFESTGDPNIPIKSVCNLLNAKIECLLENYHNYGIFHRLFSEKQNEIKENVLYKRLLDLLIKKGYSEYEQYC